jgi:hypothetical protein
MGPQRIDHLARRDTEDVWEILAKKLLNWYFPLLTFCQRVLEALRLQELGGELKYGRLELRGERVGWFNRGTLSTLAQFHSWCGRRTTIGSMGHGFGE